MKILAIDAISEPGGMIVSYAEHEEPISIEFLNASKRKLSDPQNLWLAIATELGIPLKSKREALLSKLNHGHESSRRIFQPWILFENNTL